MPQTPKILAFSGSLRKESFNRKILKIAIEGANNEGVEVREIDLNDYPLPIFNQDDQDKEGLPKNAKELKKLMKEHQGFLIASPEYNSSISGALKNVIDWASRQETPQEPMLDVFNGKIAALISASPSWMGGMRGLAHLRELLSNINVLVLPGQAILPSAHEAFKENELKDSHKIESFKKIGKSLADFLKKHHC